MGYNREHRPIAKSHRMPAVSILLNILWILTGGAWMAFGWLIRAVIMAIPIIGLPWARAAFNIAVYTLLPFGQTAVSRDAYTGREDLGTGILGTLGNIIWFIFAGWVAGARSYPFRAGSRRNHHRPALRLGTPETRRSRTLADRQD